MATLMILIYFLVIGGLVAAIAITAQRQIEARDRMRIRQAAADARANELAREMDRNLARLRQVTADSRALLLSWRQERHLDQLREIARRQH